MDTPHKIVQVAAQWAETKGGPSTYVRHLSTELRRMGHEVTVLTWGTGDGARHLRAGSLRGARDIYDDLRELQPDIVHVHGRLQGVAPAAAFRMLEKRDARVFFTYHTMPSVRDYLDIPGGNRPFYEGVRRPAALALLAACDRITAVSHSILESLNEHYRLGIRDYGVVRSASDVTIADARTTADARARWGTPGRGPLLCTVGVFMWDWKVAGHKLAIAAVGRLRERFPQIELLIAGDGHYRSYLEGYIRELGLQGHVRLLGNVEDVTSVLAAADLYVHMGLNEGSPHAIIDAMAAGKPIVAAACAGIPEIVEHGTTGWLVAPSESELAVALARLLDAPDLMKHLGERASRYARTELTWERSARDYLALYTHCLNRVSS